MDSWKFIKEEPEDNESYEAECDYFEISESYSPFKSELLCDAKTESGEEFYSTFEPEELCDIKVESKEEFFEKEENNNQDTEKTTSSYYPELSIPLVRIENSQNQEITKYLKPLEPEVTSSTSLHLENKTIKLNLNLKTESVELQTLTENTIDQSSENYRYASPWDFVSVSNSYDQNNLKKNTTKTEFDDNNLSNKVIKKEYEDETFRELFTNKSPLPGGVSKKKFIQKTLNFKVVEKQRKDENTNPKSILQSYNCDSPKHISKFQPRYSNSNSYPDKSFFCKLCNMYFARKSNLKQHRCNQRSNENLGPSKFDKKIFSCKVCGKPDTQMSELCRHCETHTVIKRFECDVCEKTFKKKAYLHDHILRHINSNQQYFCDNCSRVYKRKATLRRHITMFHAEDMKIMKCTPRSHIHQFGSKSNNNNNKTTIEAPLMLYKCHVCGQGFEDKSSMEVHVEFLHIEISEKCAAKNRPRPPKLLLDKPYQCRTCKKSYTQSSHLKRHQESHLSNKSHICRLCNQTFTTTSSLTRHLLNKHNEMRSMRNKKSFEKKKKTSKDFRCKICDHVSPSFGDLLRHCAIHDARKPYECDICKKQFAVKGYLYAHILTHDNWKPYPCQKCSKIYRRKSSLQRHINISHSGKRKKHNNAEFA